MILDAEQARKRARENTPTSKLVEQIIQAIIAQSDSGKFHLVYWPVDENNYTICHVAEALRKLGYLVTVSHREEGLSLWIDWDE